MKSNTLIMAVIGLFSATCSADSLIGFSGFSPSSTDTSRTVGYAFNITVGNLFATHLGLFDYLGDGLAESHQVGLWNPSGDLIASMAVPQGTSAALDPSGMFRMVDIVDVPLPVGNGYILGAVFQSGSLDFQAVLLSGLTMATGSQFAGDRYALTGTTILTRPSSSLNFTGFVGPTLELGAPPATVPEPSSLYLVVLPLVLLAVRQRR